MRLPNYQRLRSSDFDEEYKELIEQLSFPINRGFELLYNTLNKNTTFTDNIASNIKQVTLAVDSDGFPKNNNEFKLTNPNIRVVGLWLIDVRNQTNPNIFPNGGVTPSWEQTKSGIKINNLTGIPANIEFTFTFLVIN